jgi:hypothetical protein
MAEPVQIQGTNEQGKIRNPLGVVGLSLITLGIYYFFWYYQTNRELALIGRARNTEECGTSPGTSLLAVTLGIFVIVPPFVSLYKFCQRLSAAERVTGTPQGMEPGLLFLLLIFIGPVGQYIVQSNLNKVLERQAQPGGQIPAGPEAPVTQEPVPQSPPTQPPPTEPPPTQSP